MEPKLTLTNKNYFTRFVSFMLLIIAGIHTLYTILGMFSVLISLFFEVKSKSCSGSGGSEGINILVYCPTLMAWPLRLIFHTIIFLINLAFVWLVVYIRKKIPNDKSFKSYLVGSSLVLLWFVFWAIMPFYSTFLEDTFGYAFDAPWTWPYYQLRNILEYGF